ncbi:PadR family transcriptional regulator [Xylocopilactobacillus apicola]|uniref:PadR family transcriptional regulator n=1 Tax=Xylocopilactobacillus apicola TaxID=2932184 RepID=A0AAU9DEH8_9LACO|nr:PadR family transcriptional regulator [Xylocopilactobacillus apicola]BDR59282.1 PadR family transcriptional regulator [Xylocopilactobacillus apicola]
MAIQVSSELLEGAILAFIASEDLYGYALTKKIQTVLDVSESTVYPVLRRLTKDDYLKTYDEPFQGRNRRYYQITETGKLRLAIIQTEWKDYRGKIDGVLRNHD